VIADDLFAGAGGWDLAATQLGIHARGIEIMPEARATRDAAGLTTIHDDVWTFVPDGKASGKIASPPCPTFSTAGKSAGTKALGDVLRGIRDDYYSDLGHLRFLGLEVGDDRTALVLTPLHFATQYEYDWLAWEQVPPVLPVWEACAEALRARGWHVWTGVLNAEQYGVPQTRKRAVLLASRRGPIAAPRPTHSRYYGRTPDRIDTGVLKWVSMAEALTRGLVREPAPTVAAGGARASFSGAEWGGSSIRAKLHAAHESGDPRVWRNRTHFSGAGSSSQLQVPRAVTTPAHAVTGAGNAEWHSRPTPASGPRQRYHDAIRVTPEEAGVLQTFPADFPWQGPNTRKYLQAGNAVPPGLALHALGAAAGIDAREVAA